MTISVPPALSVLVATRNRAASLAQLLTSLEATQSASGIDTEIVVADNGSTDGTATLLQQWAAGAPGRIHLRAEQPGKARALNQALRQARAPLFAFVDDDERV